MNLIDQKMKLKSSLSWQVIRRIFWVYGFAAMFLTVGQLWFDYRGELDSIKKQLVSAHSMFGPQLGIAFFNVDDAMLQRIETGVLSDPVVTGVAIYDGRAGLNRGQGDIPISLESLGQYAAEQVHFFEIPGTDTFGHQASLISIDEDGNQQKFGHLFFFSNYKIAFDHILTSALLVLLNSMLKMAVLVSMFLLVFHRTVLAPLGRFTSSLDHIHINALDETRIDLGLSEENELSYLAHRFNALIENLGEAHEETKLLNEDLERRVLERTTDFKIAKKEAEAASQAKSDFLANMSHEIRTPLNAVLGFGYLAEQTSTSPKQKNYLNKIQGSAQHLLSVIDDILDFSKIEAGKLLIDTVPFNLDDVLSLVTSFVETDAKEKGLDVYVTVSDNVPRTLLGDPLRLKQVLGNLVSNAVKFTSQGQVQISVAVEESGDNDVTLRFEVADTGIGMTPDQIGNIFSSFQQADTSTTRQFGGTGLGLAISMRLAEMMDGEINVESEHGKGSVFQLSIPFTLADESDLEPAPAEADVISLEAFRGARVLLVEDHPFNQHVASEIMKRSGLHVDIVENGKLAVEKVENVTENFYDAILMDIQMPVMDGCTATGLIRKFRPNLPIIAMTAHVLKEQRKSYMEAGMDDYIAKPISVSNLSAVLSNWIKPEGSAKS